MIEKIAVIGGGLAGGSVARTLRDEGFEGEITVYGDEMIQPYDRPALSKAALLDPASGPQDLFPIDWAEGHGIDFVRGARVTRIDPEIGRLQFEGGATRDADVIVLATGCRARRLPVPGAMLPGVLTLRTWDDTLALRGAIAPGTRLAVIGGGLIGCEIATTATKIGAQVTLVEANDALLERVLGRDVGAFCRDELAGMGINILVGAKVLGIEGADRATGVRLDGDRVIDCDLVLVSIGAEPAAELAAEAGLACAGGVLVDALGKTSSAKVYASGDVAVWPLRDGGARCLETYLNSQAQGETVARAILGKAAPSPQVPKAWTEIAGHRIQTVGDIAGPGRRVVRAKPEGASAIHFRVADDGRVLAAIAVEAPADFAAAMRMVEGGVVVDPDQLADVSVPMKQLLRPRK